jgi:hypothetical protein
VLLHGADRIMELGLLHHRKALASGLSLTQLGFFEAVTQLGGAPGDKARQVDTQSTGLLITLVLLFVALSVIATDQNDGPLQMLLLLRLLILCSKVRLLIEVTENGIEHPLDGLSPATQ